MYCYVRDCPNGLKSLKKKKNSDLTKFFPAPEDKNLLEKWRRVVPEGENVLCSKDKLCDSHFLPSEVLWFTETKLPNGNVRRLLRDEPILRPGTIPSIFPAERLEKENDTLPGKERQDTPRPVKNVPSFFMKEKSATPKSIVKNTNLVKEKIETPKSNFRIRFKDPIASSGKRNPKRVKRRSTILDDYWTDEELNQVHNPGGASKAAGSAKKRKTESTGLQPVIRLVPLECLMDKTVSKSKTPCKPVGGSRPSTEEIDLELKKVIEIPLLTSLKPNKSLMIRSTKETIQFKPPKKNVSKSKAKMMTTSEILVSLDEVTADSSEGFNEVKTETPDIEEELARMEMDEENEDVKSSDIVEMNPPVGEDDNSVVVKSEEEDDGYSINEAMEHRPLNIPEGDEIPTIKSESEEELLAESEAATVSEQVTESEAATVSEQVPSLPTENSDRILSMHEQSNVVPEVLVEVEQNKNVEEQSPSEGELVGNSAVTEAQDPDNTSSNKETEEGEKTKVVEEERVLEDQEKEKNRAPGEEGEVDIPTEATEELNKGEGQDGKVQSGEKDSQDSQVMEPERKNDESTLETESSLEVDPKRKEGESAMEIEKETLQVEETKETSKPVESEETSKPIESEETSKPTEIEETSKLVESQEMPKPVEIEASQAPEEEMKDAIDDGKDSGVTVEGPTAEMVDTNVPSVAEPEKNLSQEKEILSEKAGDPTDSGSMNETDKGESGTVITINDVPSKPDVNDKDMEGVEADKELTSEIHQEADGIIDVDLTETTDQALSNMDTPVEQSSASQEAHPEKNDESAMETEHGDEAANVQNAEDVVDIVDTNLDTSPAEVDEEVAEPVKDTENDKSDNGQAEQRENEDEMDIEAEVARLVSEVDETAGESPNNKVGNEGREGDENSSQQEGKQPDKESPAKEASQPQEIVLQDTTNLGGITAAGVQNLFSQETIQEILKQIKLPLTTPVTFRIASQANTPSSSSSGRGRGRRKGMRGMRGTNRQVVSRASSSRDSSHNSIDVFRHLTRTRTVFDFPTFVPDIDDDIQYWKLCQILKESFHELIETRNTKTSIGKLTLRVAINRPKKPKVQQNNVDSEVDP